MCSMLGKNNFNQRELWKPRTLTCCAAVLDAVTWTHWGCCVCTEDRCAAAAARGRYNLCDTHEDTAAPADTETGTTPRRTHKQFMLIHYPACSLYAFVADFKSVRVLSDLVVIKRFQTDCTVVRLYRLGWVTPSFGLTVCFGLQGRHSLQDILFRKELKNYRAEHHKHVIYITVCCFCWPSIVSVCGHNYMEIYKRDDT